MRKPAEKHRVMESRLIQAESRRRVIGFLVEELVVLSEVERLNLIPTDAETTAYIQPQRDICQGAGQSQCRQIIQDFGYDNAEDYWKDNLDVYRMMLGQERLIQSKLEERCFARDSTNEGFYQARIAYIRNLRRAARIIWQDEELKRMY